jgi:hypothetical protein
MIYFFLFSCYFIRDVCTAVQVAQCVCVYEWTFIYILGIVIANIYCMYIIILNGKVCMVKIKFVLIVWPSLFLLINLVSHFLNYFIPSCYVYTLYLGLFSIRVSFIKPVFPSSWHDKLCLFHIFRHFLSVIYSAHVFCLYSCGPVTVKITVGTSGVTNQSVAFDPHPDVDLVYKKTKGLQLRRDTFTRDQGSYTFEAPCN